MDSWGCRSEGLFHWNLSVLIDQLMKSWFGLARPFYSKILAKQILQVRVELLIVKAPANGTRENAKQDGRLQLKLFLQLMDQWGKSPVANVMDGIKSLCK